MSQQPAIPPYPGYPCTTHELAAGESLLLQARAGTRLVAQSGNVVLAYPPVWLGEQVVWPRTPLEAGASQLISESGWITLSGGRRGGSVCVVQPQTGVGWPGLAWRVWRLWRGLAVFAGLARA